jgi:hypothetical protein
MTGNLNIQIARALDQVGKEVVAIYKSRVPVKTGALRRSITHSISVSGDSVTLSFGYLEYGKFINLGTGQYRDSNRYGVYSMPAWNATPGKGRFGIKPRYWTSLSDRQNFIEEEVQKILAQMANQIGE